MGQSYAACLRSSAPAPRARARQSERELCILGPVRGRLEVDPAVFREVHLRPTVAVRVSYRPAAAALRDLARGVPGGQPRRDSRGAKHDGHGRAVVVAVALPGLEQEMVDAVGAQRGLLDVPRIGEGVAAQVVLDRQRLVERRLGVPRDVDGQIAHPLRQALGQLQIVVPDEAAIVGACGPQVLLGRARDEGVHLIAVLGLDAVVERPGDDVRLGQRLPGEVDALEVGAPGFARVLHSVQDQIGRQQRRYPRLDELRHR